MSIARLERRIPLSTCVWLAEERYSEFPRGWEHFPAWNTTVTKEWRLPRPERRTPPKEGALALNDPTHDCITDRHPEWRHGAIANIAR